MNPIGLIYHVYLIIEDPKLEATTSNRSNVSRLLLVAELELEWSREKRCFALPLELREKTRFRHLVLTTHTSGAQLFWPLVIIFINRIACYCSCELSLVLQLSLSGTSVDIIACQMAWFWLEAVLSQIGRNRARRWNMIENANNK